MLSIVGGLCTAVTAVVKQREEGITQMRMTFTGTTSDIEAAKRRMMEVGAAKQGCCGLARLQVVMPAF